MDTQTLCEEAYLRGYKRGKQDAIKHAHWIDVVEKRTDWNKYLGSRIIETKKKACSRCRKTNKNYAPPYCPHCGALMDEEE